MLGSISNYLKKLIPTAGVAPDVTDEMSDRLMMTWGSPRDHSKMDVKMDHYITVCGLKRRSVSPTVCDANDHDMATRLLITHITHGHTLYQEVYDYLNECGEADGLKLSLDNVRRTWGYGFSLYYKEKLIHPTNMHPLCVYNIPECASVNIVYHPMIGGGKFTWFGRGSAQNKIVVSNEPLVIFDPVVHVSVVYNGYVRMFPMTYARDAYTFTRGLICEWENTHKSYKRTLMTSRFTLWFRNKPLPDRAVSARDLGIKNLDSLELKLFGGLGGAPILPTYSIVEECEKELLLAICAQSEEMPTGGNPMEMLMKFVTLQLRHTLSRYDEDYVTKLLEDIMIFWQMMTKARCFADYYQAVVVYVKLRDPKPFLKTHLMKQLLAYVDELFGHLKNTFVPQSIELFSDCLGTVRTGLDKFDEIKKSPIFARMYKLSMFVLANSLFEKFGITFDKFNYSRIEAEAIKRKYHMGVDFFYTLVDTIVFLLERGLQCMKTGSLDPIFHSGSQYEKWFDKACELKQQSLCLSNPEAMGFSVFQFLADLDESIESGRAIYKHAVRVGENERKMVRGVLAELEMIKSNMTTKRAAQQERNMPFPILLFGGSSVGKSTLTKMLFYHYGKLFDLPTSSEYKYVRNPVAKFWDGFTTSQWCVHFDDIGYLHPNVAAQGDPSVLEIIQAINYVAMVPDQAALEDKGRTPMRAELVLATTNVEHLNAVHYFQTPLAVQRRMPWVIECQPKPEYAKEECMLDSSKAQLVEGEWPNYWKFTVRKVVPADPQKREGGRAKFVVEHVFMEVEDFLAWFGATAMAHKKVQGQIDDCDANMQAMTVCKTCYRSSNHCICLLSQAIERPENMYRVRYWWLLMCLALLRYWCTHFQSLVGTDAFERWWFGVSNTTDDEQLRHERARSRFRKLGDSVRKILGTPDNILLISGALVTMAGAYAAYKGVSKMIVKHTITPENTDEVGQAPPPRDDEKQNVWYKDDFEMTAFDLPVQTASWSQMPEEEVIGRLSRNVIHCCFRRSVNGESKIVRGQAVALGGHLFVTNTHNVKGDCELTAVFGQNTSGIRQKVTCQLRESTMYRAENTGLVFFQIKNMPPMKRVLGLIATKLGGCLRGALIQREECGSPTQRPIHALKSFGDVTLPTGEFITNAWQGYAAEPTMVGDCGSLVVAFGPQGPIIVGIHAFSSTYDDHLQGSAPLLLECVNQAVAHFKRPLVGVGTPFISAPGFEREVADLHPKSTMRYIEDGSAVVYGSFTGFRPKPVSRVVPTVIAEAMEDEGYTVKFGKPVMKGYQPWRHAALEMVKPVTKLDPSILEKCLEGFKKDIKDNLPAAEWDEMMVYDDFTTLNGAAGVAFVDKMNRNTSMGNPFKKSKKFFLIDDEPRDGIMDPVKFTPEIMERIQEMHEAYKRGERVLPNFCGHLKDEAKKFKKIIAGKTRLFTGGPADWAFLVRKYYLSFVRVMQRNRFVFECGPGTNCASTQWQDIYEYLTKWGTDNMIAGDYAAFDKSMPAEMILAAFDILIWMGRTAGFTSEDILIMTGIAEDTAFPLVDFDGDLIQFLGSNPSGHPLTVIINGLANSLYMRYCYFVLSPDDSVENFKRDVRLMTYGDDNIAGIRPGASWYNHTAIQSTLADIGVTYTMADKEAKSVPYISIDQCDFLKRKWRWDADVGAYLAPLDEESIEKSLLRVVQSKTISPESQAVAVMESAHAEYFFYGREVFEEKAQMFKRVVKKCGLEPYVSDNSFPSWEELYNRFWSAS